MWCAKKTLLRPLRAFSAGFVLFCLSALSLIFAGCSVQPLSDIEQITSVQMRAIELPENKTREQQIMNQTLSGLIGYSAMDKRYRLDFQLTQATRTALSSAGVSSQLNNTTMSLSYQLYDISSGRMLTSGQTNATATSGNISSYYGQDVSLQFASERLVKLLADKLHSKLQLYFASVEG